MFKKIDWLCFSFRIDAGEFVSEMLVKEFGEDFKVSKSKFHNAKVSWECGIHLFTLPRARTNCLNMLEFSGEFFRIPGAQKFALDLCKFVDGSINRIDVAFDIHAVSPLHESIISEDMRGLKTARQGVEKTVYHVGNKFSGFTVGYGKGSEVCLRVYDKAREQGEKYSGPGWWRVEITIRGKTAKAQRKWLENWAGLGKWFVGKKIRAGKLWRKYDHGSQGLYNGEVVRQQTDPSGESYRLYWERVHGKALRKLRDIGESQYEFVALSF